MNLPEDIIKVCIVGDHPKAFWKGSATFKVQMNVFNELHKSNYFATLFYKKYKSGFLKRYFSTLKIERLEHGNIIEGGIVIFLMYLIFHKYNIIHFIVNRPYMMLFSLIRPLISAKYVITFHDLIAFPKFTHTTIYNIKLYCAKYILLKISDAVLLYNKESIELLKECFPNSNCILIKNGIDISEYHRAGDFSNIKNKIITFAGGLGKNYKGLQFLMDSLGHVTTKYTLEICGEISNPEIHNENFIGELDKSDFITQLQKSRILVIPSSYESFSLTGLEAMACGVPIIITRNCGLSEHLMNGKGCFIIKYGDERALAEKIMLLLNDDKLWLKISDEAVIAMKEFEWSGVIEQYIGLYRNLLNS